MLETVADALADVFSFTKEERTNFLKIWGRPEMSPPRLTRMTFTACAVSCDDSLPGVLQGSHV